MRLRLFQDFSRLSAHLQSAGVGFEKPLITFLPCGALSHRVPLVFDCVRNLLGVAHFEDMHFYVPFLCIQEGLTIATACFQLCLPPKIRAET